MCVCVYMCICECVYVYMYMCVWVTLFPGWTEQRDVVAEGWALCWPTQA